MTIAALATLGLAVAPASAAPGDPSQARADVLLAELLAGALVGSGAADAAAPGGPPLDQEDLDVALLRGDLELVDGGLQLPLIDDGTNNGLLDLGDVGALSSHASTPSQADASAAAGVITDDGAIALDPDEDPADAGTAGVDLTSLLGQLGIDGLTDQVIDELELQIGALASSAQATAGAGATSDYRVTDLQVQVHSDLVGGLTTALRGGVSDVTSDLTSSLDSLVGTGGALTQILSGIDVSVLGLADVDLDDPTIAVNTPDLGAVLDTALGDNAILVSDDESVTIDLTNGTITVDLAQIVNPGGTGLNGMPANTSVLTDETITAITDGIANALGKIVTPLTNAVSAVLDETTVEISIGVEASLLFGIVPVIGGDLTIGGTLAEVIAGQHADGSSLGDVDLTVLGLGGTQSLISSLTNVLLNTTLPAILGPLGTTVQGVLDTTAQELTDTLTGIVSEVVSGLNPLLDEVLAQVAVVTVNSQPTLRGEASDLGADGGFTVRALEIELLPNVAGSSVAAVGLASSSVLAEGALATLDVGPDGTRPGEDVDIAGEGWDPAGGDVEVVFTDADGTALGSATAPVNADGTIEGTWTVPAGTEPGEATATATQGSTTATDTVVLAAPPSVVAVPDPVDQGGTLTITGSDFACGPVDVEILDASGVVLDTIEDVLVTDGTWQTTWDVPADVDPGTLTVHAIATGSCGDEAETEVEVEAPPTVVVNPNPVDQGEQLTITGSGFACGPVDVVITDADGTVLATIPDVPVAADGTFETTWMVPEDTEVGTLTVTATATGECDDEGETEVEIEEPPVIIVEPNPTDPGETLTITGTGFDCGPVDITIADADGTVLDTILGVPVDASGGFSVTWDVPEDTDPGSLTITAAGPDDCGEDETEVEIDDPADVEVTPNPVAPGNEITVTGSGFDCGPVDVRLLDGDVVLAEVLGVPVAADGSFSVDILVPAGTANGDYTVVATATGECEDEAEEPVTVDDGAVTIVVDPDVAERGDPVSLTGEGWDAASDVTIEITDEVGATVDTLEVPATGGEVDTEWTVPGNATLGDYAVVATQGTDEAQDTLRVVLVPTGPATLTVSPSTVEAGETVAIDGERWDPTGGDVAVQIRQQDGTVLDTVMVSVEADGALATGSWTVPEDFDAQDLLAVATQGTRTASDGFSVRESGLPVIRLWGPNRYVTAVEVSKDAYPWGASVVFLASGQNFPDALSAAPAAAQMDAPLLLTPSAGIVEATRAELDRLDPDIIVIVGGTAAVSTTVASQVMEYAGQVVRIGGANRLETSILISEYAFDTSDTAYVASAQNFPDALTTGAMSGSQGAPMLLTSGATPSAALIEALEGFGVEHVMIAGGNAAVPASQEAGFEQAGFTVMGRYSGANRYDTGVLVAQDSVPEPVDHIYVATGQLFPDALAGSAVAGAQGTPVYVTPRTCLWPSILEEVERLDDPQIVLLGGTAALTDDVFDLEVCDV